MKTSAFLRETLNTALVCEASTCLSQLGDELHRRKRQQCLFIFRGTRVSCFKCLQTSCLAHLWIYLFLPTNTASLEHISFFLLATVKPVAVRKRYPSYLPSSSCVCFFLSFPFFAQISIGLQDSILPASCKVRRNKHLFSAATGTFALYSSCLLQ